MHTKENPVPEQSQAAFVPNPMNQYPANPVQPADPNMGMNAVAKTNIPESTQVHARLRWPYYLSGFQWAIFVFPV